MAKTNADASALVRAIQLDPLAENPRLAYADWLAHRGQLDRAQAVRLGSTRMGLGKSEDHEHAQQRRAIDQQLAHLSRDESLWAGELPKMPGLRWHAHSVGGLFERLFILDVADFRRHACELFDDQPVFSIGFLSGSRTVAPDFEHLESAFAVPEMERMGGLSTLGVLHGNIVIEAIAKSEALRNLKVLRLWMEAIDDDGAEVIAKSTRLATLTELDLHGNNLTGTGCRSLACAGQLERLEDLNLADNEVDSAGASALAKAHWATSLRWLDLSNNAFEADGAIALANSPRLTNLTGLNLKGNAIGPHAAAAIFSTQELRNLTHLSLTVDTPNSGSLVPSVAGTLKNLRVLRLDGKLIGMPGALGPAELSSLLGGGFLSNLTVLSLFNNPIGDSGVELLAEADGLPNLRTLELMKTGIGDAGAFALARAQSLQKLERLSLGNNQIGDKGALAIAESAVLQNLKTLILGGNPLSEPTKVQLKARFGDRLDNL